jgi:hypothetical protein
MTRVLLILLGTAIAAPAIAANVAVYAGDPTTVADRLEAATGQPASGYKIVSFSEAVKGDPVTLTAGKVEGCTGAPAKVSDVSDALLKAEAYVSDLDLGPELADVLAKGDAALLCVNEAVDPGTIARLEFLRGVALHFDGKSDEARAAFHTALVAKPDLPWDDNFPPSVRAEYDEAKGEIGNAGHVQLAVIPRNVPITIDGKPTPPVNGRLDLPEGVHLLQVGTMGLRVTLQKGSNATLIVPALVGDDALGWASDPVLGIDLARLLGFTVESGATYTVLTSTNVYQSAGAETWRDITPVAKGGTPSIGLILMPVGGGVFVVGGVLAVTGLTGGNAALHDASAAGVQYDEWQAAQSRYTGAKTRIVVGDVLMGVGLAVAGGGVAMQFLDAGPVSPMWLPGGGGLRLDTRF